MKLHLGCWKRYFPGWVHIDLCDFPHIDYQSKVNDLNFIQDNSVQIIYASHVFEYFDRQEAEQVLSEWRRVLEPDGILRICVPDFDKLIEVYNVTSDIHCILGPLFGRMHINDETDSLIYHKIVYNFVSLKKTLEENGFKSIERFNWWETDHANIDDHSQAYFPHMDKKNGILISLNIEAKKND